MLVFLDVLGPWDLKIVKIDPPSGTPPGIKILKTRPKIENIQTIEFSDSSIKQNRSEIEFYSKSTP